MASKFNEVERRALYKAIVTDMGRGMTAKQACAKNGVKMSSYGNWHRRFSNEKATRQTLTAKQTLSFTSDTTLTLEQVFDTVMHLKAYAAAVEDAALDNMLKTQKIEVGEEMYTIFQQASELAQNIERLRGADASGADAN